MCRRWVMGGVMKQTFNEIQLKRPVRDAGSPAPAVLPLLPKLRPGMVLNMSTNSLFGRLIRFVLARDWKDRRECPNHDAIVVEEDGKLWIGESQPPVARLTPLEQYEKEIRSGFIYRLRVLEVAGATEAQERAAAHWWLDNVRNSPYDYRGIVRLLIKAIFGNWINAAVGWEWSRWCTEGVADAWKHGAKFDPWKKINPTPLTTWTRFKQGKFIQATYTIYSDKPPRGKSK